MQRDRVLHTVIRPSRSVGRALAALYASEEGNSFLVDTQRLSLVQINAMNVHYPFWYGPESFRLIVSYCGAPNTTGTYTTHKLIKISLVFWNGGGREAKMRWWTVHSECDIRRDQFQRSIDGHATYAHSVQLNHPREKKKCPKTIVMRFRLVSAGTENTSSHVRRMCDLPCVYVYVIWNYLVHDFSAIIIS